MIFLGDIASPNPKTSEALFSSIAENRGIFENTIAVSNLEGMIYNGEIYDQGSVLYNHPSISDSLHLMNVKALSLSNNHTLDLPNQFSDTKKYLELRKIAFFGAGENFKEAAEPGIFFLGNKKYIVYGYTWDVLLHHQDNSPDNLCVNTLSPTKVINDVKTMRNNNPDAVIIVMMHWSFDLEILPFPMYRQLSMRLIDLGANAIVGSHSHCIQGGERYKDGIIIYGLGNFYMPWNIYVDGKLKFPEFAKTELIVDWNPENGIAISHFFKYNSQTHKIDLIKSEDFDTGEMMNGYSPYRNMSNHEYVRWFKSNRRKDFLIPIHKNYAARMRNRAIDYYLKKRIQFARILASLNLIKWSR